MVDGRRDRSDGVVLGLILLQLLLERALEVFLGAGGEDAGSPQLIHDEQKDQEPEGHQRPADARDRTSHAAMVPAVIPVLARGGRPGSPRSPGSP